MFIQLLLYTSPSGRYYILVHQPLPGPAKKYALILYSIGPRPSCAKVLSPQHDENQFVWDFFCLISFAYVKLVLP